MEKLQEDKLAPIVIDLNPEEGQINESFLRQFGASIELIISRMFGLNNLDFMIRGNKCALRKFADTLKKETEYATLFRKLGLADATVIKNKWKLDGAIGEFEKETGIKWPLK